MSSALLSASSVPEIITNQIQPTEDVKRTLRKSCARPIYVQPPDKGWGWVVVFGAFMCSAIVDGLIFSSPLIFGLLLDDVHASYSVTLLCTAVQIFSYLVIGPIISKYLRQDTCRRFVCVGAIVATSGFIFSAVIAIEFLTQFYFMMVFTLGLAVGCGLGCIYISSICAVSCFFVRHRIAATTIALSGSGVGMTVFPPIIAHFTKTLDFYGAMFLFAAIAFHTLFLGVLIWPLSELPPGCDLHAGQLPREKDLFDYIRERVGYPRSIAGSHDSDLSFRTRQDAVKLARERRITRLRNESESESQYATKVASAGSSPQPSSALSPLRDYLNRRNKRGALKTNGDVPTPSPNSSRSGSGTPVMHLHKMILSSSVENIHRTSSRTQSTIPCHVFSTASRTNSPMPQVSAADMTSLVGGASMVENISVITDLGHRLDNCSDVSEFFLILDPREATQDNPNSLEMPRPGQRHKSVSECMNPDGNSSGGPMIYDGSFTHTDIVPPSQTCFGDEQADEALAPEHGNGYLTKGDNCNNHNNCDNEGVGFIVGGPDESRATSPLRDTKLNEKNITPGSAEKDRNITRIDSDIGELKNGGLEMSNGKRVYRRHSSGYSARLTAIIKQRTLQKGEHKEGTPQSVTPLSSEAMLQILLNHEHDVPGLETSGEESPKSNNKISNGHLLTTLLKTSSPFVNADSRNVEQVTVPHVTETKLCPWLVQLVDPRLFVHGPCFPILCLANAFAMAGIFVPLLFIPLRVIWLDGLRQSLFPENSRSTLNSMDIARLKAGFLVSIAGSVGCIARLGVVIGTELRRSNPLVTTCIAFFVQSVVVVSSPLVSEFVILGIMLAFIAICTELYVSMTTSIIRWCFQPEGMLGGLCDPSLVNPAFSLLTIIRALSAAIGICFTGYLFSLTDPSGSCLLVMPNSPYRDYGIELPKEPISCDESFANVMYFAGSVFFVSFILHSILLARYALRTHKAKKVDSDSPESSNGTFLLQKIDGSRLDTSTK